MIRRPRRSTLFPYTTLSRSELGERGAAPEALDRLVGHDWPGNVRELENVVQRAIVMATTGVILPEHLPIGPVSAAASVDRKSTRLNSSHLVISYAVFCLKTQ